MNVHLAHQGIQYQMTEIRDGEWEWSFSPPTGSRRSGRVVGAQAFAIHVVQRGIEVWHLMNAQNEAA